MLVQTPRQASATADSTGHPIERNSLLFPAGSEDVRQRDLYREFLRWPTFLWLPLSIALLVAVGLNHPIAAIPCGVLLATVATLNAAHRATARLRSRSAAAAVSALVPKPRRGR